MVHSSLLVLVAICNTALDSHDAKRPNFEQKQGLGLVEHIAIFQQVKWFGNSLYTRLWR